MVSPPSSHHQMVLISCRGLLSYMLVCSMTIGASNTTGYQRFLGTCIGAVLAIVGWLLTRGSPFALAAFGWTISLGCFFLVIAQGKGPMGRFILLTYNLSALYAYSLSVKDGEDDEDEVSYSRFFLFSANTIEGRHQSSNCRNRFAPSHCCLVRLCLGPDYHSNDLAHKCPPEIQKWTEPFVAEDGLDMETGSSLRNLRVSRLTSLQNLWTDWSEEESLPIHI